MTTACAGGRGFLKQQHLRHHAHAVIAKARKMTRPMTRPAREPTSTSQHSLSDAAQQVSPRNPAKKPHLSVFWEKGPQLP